MKTKLLKLALCAFSLLPMGAWAIDFGTEATVNTTTTWVFNDLSSVDAGIAQIGSTSIYSRATSGRGVVTFETSGTISSFTFSDGYYLPSITKCAVMTSKGNRNVTFDVTAGSVHANGATDNANSPNPYFAFNATVAGTLYVYLCKPEKVADTDNEANAEVRFWDGSSTTLKAQATTSGVHELKATTEGEGVFYIGASAHKFGSFKVYAMRFVPTSEKKDEWVYIGETGYATYGNNSGKDIESLPTGLTAYKAAAGTTSVTLTSLGGMRRAQGYVISGTPNTNYGLTYGGETLGSEYNGGDMVRVNTDMVNFAATVDGKNRYILGNDGGTAKFFTPSGTGTLKKGKAYLQTIKTLTSAGARGISIVFEDETTGVTNVNLNANLNSKYYNLQGVEVFQPTKGLYIVNGKKVIIK